MGSTSKLKEALVALVELEVPLLEATVTAPVAGLSSSLPALPSMDSEKATVLFSGSHSGTVPTRSPCRLLHCTTVPSSARAEFSSILFVEAITMGGSSTLSTVTVTFLIVSAPTKPAIKVRTVST